MAKKKTIKKKKVYKDYKELLHEELQDISFAVDYLNETLEDPDQKVFLMALRDVLEAHGHDISAVAREAQITRPNIYRILSQNGNPRLNSLQAVLHTMGLKLKVDSADSRARK